MDIYCGNLPYAVRDDALMAMFTPFGQVTSAKVMMERETNRSKGFGFVQMPNAEEAKAAIEALNGQEANGRKLNVNEARPREERPRTGGPGGGGFGGGRPQGGGFRDRR